MALLDVSDVLDDPDFHTTIVVNRRAVVTASDGRAVASPVTVTTIGVVVPDGGVDLIQNAEGESVTGDITIYTRFALTQGDAQFGPDAVVWNGAEYRVIQSQNWLFGSGYTKAVLKLATLNPSTAEPPDDAGYLE